MRLGGQLEDPRAAGALLWPDAAAEDASKLALKRLQAAVAPGFKVGSATEVPPCCLLAGRQLCMGPMHACTGDLRPLLVT